MQKYAGKCFLKGINLLDLRFFWVAVNRNDRNHRDGRIREFKNKDIGVYRTGSDKIKITLNIYCKVTGYTEYKYKKKFSVISRRLN